MTPEERDYQAAMQDIQWNIAALSHNPVADRVGVKLAVAQMVDAEFDARSNERAAEVFGS